MLRPPTPPLLIELLSVISTDVMYLLHRPLLSQFSVSRPISIPRPVCGWVRRAKIRGGSEIRKWLHRLRDYFAMSGTLCSIHAVHLGDLTLLHACIPTHIRHIILTKDLPNPFSPSIRLCHPPPPPPAFQNHHSLRNPSPSHTDRLPHSTSKRHSNRSNPPKPDNPIDWDVNNPKHTCLASDSVPSYCR